MDGFNKMAVFGKTSMDEFLGDNIVYRNLVPVDRRLPALETIRMEMGLPAGRIPRKVELDYAQVIVHLLRQARALDAPGAEIQRLVFVGDTRMNDGTAFANVCQAGGWGGMAFIAAETSDPPDTEFISAGTSRNLYLANRWTALIDFDRFCRQQKFAIDQSTGVIVDLDKTTLGARGRNAQVIDRARVQAVQDTVAELLGTDFDEQAFQEAYDLLNQVEFHPFTRDNQDYLAYICLILGTELYDLESLVAEVKEDRLKNFEQFIERVAARAGELPASLRDIHEEIYANVQEDDPTPFKTFRRNEYMTTIAKMGFLGDETTAQSLLEDEIVITQEVREMAKKWREDGAVLFGLSDKPDEASIPTPALESQGYVAIHRKETHAVGELK